MKETSGRHTSLFKKILLHRCFPVNFAKFLRVPLLQNNSEQLLLKKHIILIFASSWTLLKISCQRLWSMEKLERKYKVSLKKSHTFVWMSFFLHRKRCSISHKGEDYRDKSCGGIRFTKLPVNCCLIWTYIQWNVNRRTSIWARKIHLLETMSWLRRETIIFFQTLWRIKSLPNASMINFNFPENSFYST